MKLHIILAAGALSLAMAGAAHAAVTVLGDSTAEACSKAAFRNQADDTAIQLCSTALVSGFLDARDEAGTFVNRGIMWLTRDDYRRARADFDQAIRTDPTLGESWVNRGAVNILEKRYEDGISDIDKGLRLGTEEPAKAYYNRAVAEEGVDDETSAYLDYQQALTLEPGWALPRQELLRFTVTRRPAGAQPPSAHATSPAATSP